MTRARVAGLLLPLLLLGGAFWASPGLFNIDETVYLAAAEAMARRGSLVVENGYETFGAEALKLWFLVEGPRGLVPQYPAGSAILGGPMAALLGARGLIVLNAAAAVGLFFAARALALRLFGDARAAALAGFLLLLGGFWLEFAWGIWPHAIATLLSTLALTLTLRALDEPERAMRWAALAGAALGAACLFRLDAVLAIAGIGAGAVLYARAPLRMIAAGAAGMLPPLAALSAANLLKFGDPNPFSYGRAAGETQLAAHLPMLGAGVLGLGLLAAMRGAPPRRIALGAGGCALLLGAAAAAEPGLRAMLLRAGGGAWALLVDIRDIQPVRPEMVMAEDGTVRFLGLVKKALGQSLPWLGLLAAIPFLRWDARGRRGLTLCAISAAAMAAPFIPSAWYGGLGSNMRYFLPATPLLAALGAAILVRLGDQAGGVKRPAMAGGAAGIALCLLWMVKGPGGAAGAQQMLSVLLLGLIACAAAAAAATGARGLSRFAVGAGAAGMAAAALFGLLDLAASQGRRVAVDRIGRALAEVPAPSLMIGPPELFAGQIERPDAFIAAPRQWTFEIDENLVLDALSRGYAVWMLRADAETMHGAAADIRFGREIASPGGPLVEILPPL